ncbi:hypothetical protein NCC78_02035 [Micromonospora phytophila]|uniref:hypothetical protein n=1 Tax=Micromonospora phytophila TaxID=709888 RepID=UPI00202E36FF|nr:hypothetical protein [Micromonospora phytophila]MCM0673506.1 hypothetical protein [Micromonospora phytophila]
MPTSISFWYRRAAHVAGAALRSPGTQLYHRLDDVRLRGLLHLLREDERVVALESGPGSWAAPFGGCAVGAG